MFSLTVAISFITAQSATESIIMLSVSQMLGYRTFHSAHHISRNDYMIFRITYLLTYLL